MDKNHGNRRDFLKQMATVAAATVGLSWTQRVNAQDDEKKDPTKIIPRFTLPAGHGAHFAHAPILDDNGYLRWGMNSAVGTYKGSQIILTGENIDPDDAVLGVRIVDANHIKKDESEKENGKAKEYIWLGETKVMDAEVGSAMISFLLQPGQSLQMLNMGDTIVVAQEEGVQPAPKKLKELEQRLGYVNESNKPQQIVLIVPPNEHTMRAGKDEKALDLTMIRRGMDLYAKTPNAKKKTEIFEKLEPLVWNAFAKVVMDAGYKGTAQELRGIYMSIILPDPKVKPADDRKRRLGQLQDLTTQVMDARQGQPEDHHAIFSDEEVTALLLKDAEAQGKKSLMLEYMEKVIPAQIKTLQKQAKSK